MFPVAVAAVFPVTAAVGVDGMDERASDDMPLKTLA